MVPNFPSVRARLERLGLPWAGDEAAAKEPRVKREILRLLAQTASEAKVRSCAGLLGLPGSL